MAKEEDKVALEDVDLSAYSIFYPKSKNGIVNDYPELKKFKSFREINANDALFVWYYACEASPFIKITNDRTRAEKSIEKAFVKDSKKVKKSQVDRDRYLSGKFPAKVDAAIHDMKSFKIGPRLLASKSIETALFNTSTIINQDMSAIGVDQKEYISMVKDAVAVLPKLVSLLEGNFSVSEKEGESSESSIFDPGSAIENFHKKQE